MTDRKYLLQALFLVLTFVALSCQTGCHKKTEEDKIKNVIAGIQKAVREKDTGTVMGHLSRAYTDPQGNNYDGVKGLLLFYFMKHQQVNAFVPDIDISMENNAARASFQAVLTGAGGSDAGSDAGLLPEALGVYVFNVVMQKESGTWKITSAKWERIGDGPLMKE